MINTRDNINIYLNNVFNGETFKIFVFSDGLFHDQKTVRLQHLFRFIMTVKIVDDQ